MKEIAQIGIVVKDLKESMEKYWKIFGIGPWDIYTFTPSTMEPTPYTKPLNCSFRIALAKMKNIQIELIQPLEGPTLHRDFLEKRGEGVHHIKEKLTDDEIPLAIEKYEKAGIKVIQGAKFKKDLHFYLDTEELLGFIYELGNDADVGPPEERYPPET
ncbi:MAG: VOC family protein [Candidatus Bathyarchaeia archaeon]